MVVEIYKTPNSYWVKSDTSTIYRNRWHLVSAPYYRDVSHSVTNNVIINPSKSPIFDRKPNANDDQNAVCNENVLLKENVEQSENDEIIDERNQDELSDKDIRVQNERPFRLKRPPAYLKNYLT